MNKFGTTMITVTRAVVVTLGLAAAAVSVAQASAQSFSFEMQGGSGRHGGHNGDWNDNQGYGTRCLTNREVRSGVAANGFSQVNIVRELSRDRVDVQAVKRGGIYAMRVDKCTGRVSDPQWVGRAQGGYNGGHNGGWQNGNGSHGNNNGYNNGGGFGFQFNFGN
ncbi:MAG: hypothetical protein KKF33_05355 [Alphaproteobacteria bacterium]|nr:hypothetical protein [Alphaproteobacteria bacterium]